MGSLLNPKVIVSLTSRKAIGPHNEHLVTKPFSNITINPSQNDLPSLAWVCMSSLANQLVWFSSEGATAKCYYLSLKSTSTFMAPPPTINCIWCIPCAYNFGGATLIPVPSINQREQPNDKPKGLILAYNSLQVQVPMPY